jgi:hypothetical protein
MSQRRPPINKPRPTMNKPRPPINKPRPPMTQRRIGAGSSRPPAPDDGAEQLVELTVVARQAGVRLSLVRRYVAFGLVEPRAGTSEAPLFTPVSAARVARAERLRRDLGLNYAGAVLVSELLDRIDDLEDRSRRDAPD